MSNSPYETVTTTRHFFSVFEDRAGKRDFEIECTHEGEVYIWDVYKSNQIEDSVEMIWLEEGKWVWEDPNPKTNYFGYFGSKFKSRDFMGAILDHVNTHGLPKIGLTTL